MRKIWVIIFILILILLYISGMGWTIYFNIEATECKVKRTRLLMEKLTIENYLDNPPLDAWGNGIWFGKNNWISPGPDGKVGTDDDVLVPIKIEND